MTKPGGKGQNENRPSTDAEQREGTKDGAPEEVCEYSNWTIPKLKDELRRRHMQVSGVKATLVARLESSPELVGTDSGPKSTVKQEGKRKRRKRRKTRQPNVVGELRGEVAKFKQQVTAHNQTTKTLKATIREKTAVVRANELTIRELHEKSKEAAENAALLKRVEDLGPGTERSDGEDREATGKTTKASDGDSSALICESTRITAN